MKILSKQDVELIDTILERLWTGSSQYVISYTILKANFPQYIENKDKAEFKRLFTSLGLCEIMQPETETCLKLTSFGLEVMGKYGSYSKYLEHQSLLQARENDIYENSKSALKLTKRTFNWTMWNTIFVIIGVIITAIVLYITIYPQTLN